MKNNFSFKQIFIYTALVSQAVFLINCATTGARDVAKARTGVTNEFSWCYNNEEFRIYFFNDASKNSGECKSDTFFDQNRIEALVQNSLIDAELNNDLSGFPVGQNRFLTIGLSSKTTKALAVRWATGQSSQLVVLEPDFGRKEVNIKCSFETFGDHNMSTRFNPDTGRMSVSVRPTGGPVDFRSCNM